VDHYSTVQREDLANLARIGYRSLVDCRTHDFIHRTSPPPP
jgi:hypothetical protein